MRDVSSLCRVGKGTDDWDATTVRRCAIVGMELGRYSESEGLLQDTASVYDVGGTAIERSRRYNLIAGVLLVEISNFRIHTELEVAECTYSYDSAPLGRMKSLFDHRDAQKRFSVLARGLL